MAQYNHGLLGSTEIRNFLISLTRKILSGGLCIIGLGSIFSYGKRRKNVGLHLHLHIRHCRIPSHEIKVMIAYAGKGNSREAIFKFHIPRSRQGGTEGLCVVLFGKSCHAKLDVRKSEGGGANHITLRVVCREHAKLKHFISKYLNVSSWKHTGLGRAGGNIAESNVATYSMLLNEKCLGFCI